MKTIEKTEKTMILDLLVNSNPLYEEKVTIDESITIMVINIKIKAREVFLLS